jgi:hypothetical protein
MKRCPQCHRTYADESITFCLADGALLSAPYDPEATQQIPFARFTNPTPTEILPSTYSQPIQPKGSPKIIYPVVALMALLIIALAGIILVPLILRDRKAVNNEAALQPDSRTAINANTTVLPSPTKATVNPTSQSQAVPAELTGKWQGQWSSPYGTIFSANAYLEPTGTGSGVQGYINWTMKSSPQEAKQSKIGLTAVEFVRGSYSTETRMLTMEGYREDDPNDIITPDKYRLVLSADNSSLGGATWNHGGWRGRFSLSR